MSGFLSQLKDKFSKATQVSVRPEKIPEEKSEEYVEIGADATSDSQAKIMVRSFVLDNFENIKPILDALREGYTIALINIQPLKEKDLVELKRAINKLKKTTDAIDGDIAGFAEDWIVATPSFASVYRSGAMSDFKEEKPNHPGGMSSVSAGAGQTSSGSGFSDSTELF